MNGAIAKCIFLFLVAFVTAAVAQESPHSESREAVWIWSGRCSGDHKLGVTVRLDSKVLFRATIPVVVAAVVLRMAVRSFILPGGHMFQGEHSTRTTDSIEGDIWQTDGEPDEIVLGISFDTGEQILLNTLHIAKPEK